MTHIEHIKQRNSIRFVAFRNEFCVEFFFTIRFQLETERSQEEKTSETPETKRNKKKEEKRFAPFVSRHFEYTVHAVASE